MSINLYIKGYHPKAPKDEFWWRASSKLIRQGVNPGESVWVQTKYGIRWIIVTEVLSQASCLPAPSPVNIRMAYGLKKV